MIHNNVKQLETENISVDINKAVMKLKKNATLHCTQLHLTNVLIYCNIAYKRRKIQLTISHNIAQYNSNTRQNIVSHFDISIIQ